MQQVSANCNHGDDELHVFPLQVPPDMLSMEVTEELSPDVRETRHDTDTR